MEKRKICVVVTARASYARIKSVLRAIQDSPDLSLQLLVGASALLFRFGKVVDIIEEDGFRIARTLYSVIEGENLVTQAKTAGLGIIELSSAFEELSPDIVLTVADRFETISTAIASAYMNIPLAHVQGGEISGSVDEKVRHAVTKLSDFHFCATLKSAERVMKMGEEKKRVFVTGCPAMDLLTENDLTANGNLSMKYQGVGCPIDFAKPYILMVYHPVTTSFGKGFKEISSLLNILKQKPEQKIVLWPNIDAGSDDVAKGIRIFREQNPQLNFHYYRGFAPEDYARVLNCAVCAVGNSSSFIREGAFLGVPAVIVGNRQNGREHGKNVVFSNFSKHSLKESIDFQIKHGKYSPEKIYGDGKAGIRIANILAKLELILKKKITY